MWRSRLPPKSGFEPTHSQPHVKCLNYTGTAAPHIWTRQAVLLRITAIPVSVHTVRAGNLELYSDLFLFSDAVFRAKVM